MDENDILIDERGNVRFVYSDLLDDVFREEARETTRASHVEPYGTGWSADMTPSGGPVLFEDGACDSVVCAFHRPFKTRAEALAAERAWLRENRGL